MRKAGMIIPAFLICMNASVLGQVYFDTLFDEGQLVETLTNVVKLEDGYKFTMRSRDATVDTAAMVMVSLNSEGNEVSRTPFAPNSRTLTSGELVQVQSGGYVLFNSVGTAPSNSIRDCSTIRYDSNGNALWIQQYGDVLRDDICFYGVICSDGSYGLFGQSAEADLTEADMMLIRTDSIGNEIWIKYYGGNFFEGAGNSGLIQTPDSGFLLLGWTRSYGAGQRDFYLVKTDSAGNQEWQRTYGGSTDEGGSSIIKLSDGNFLLTGSGSQGTNMSIGRMYKIDPEGNVIWAKTYSYNNNQGNNLHRTIELWNGDLVSAGLTDLTDNGGWLLRTDSSGNELWQREFNKNQYTDLFYSVLLANDGGFLLSGQARNAETNSQDAWLLKVDSAGCPYPNCNVGVDELDSRRIVADVWPNPASDVLNLEFQHQEKTEYRMFDMSGRLMNQSTTTQMRATMDVSAFENGLYLLSILQGEMKTTLKVVVEH